MAVNPYQTYTIYGNDQISMYKQRKAGELPPHVFAVAESAYEYMKRTEASQCIVIRYVYIPTGSVCYIYHLLRNLPISKEKPPSIIILTSQYKEDETLFWLFRFSPLYIYKTLVTFYS